ncbi:NADP-dependent oxidoreductase [Nocardioides endophyticus]
MLAVQIDSPGPISALRVRSIVAPIPGTDEVAIDLIASSLNPADIKIRTGAVVPATGNYPYTLGYDLVGTVVATGLDIADLDLGDRVLAMSAVALTGRGAWAERVCLPRAAVARLSDDLEASMLARLPLIGLTAYQAVRRADPAADESVLVAGAAGSVGRLVVQLLLHRGARVHALVRTPDQVGLLPEDALLTHHVGQAPTGIADVVIDAAGGDFATALVEKGRYVGLVPDQLPSRDALAARGVRRDVVITQESGADLANLVDLVRRGVLTLPRSRCFPLNEIHAAHKEYEQDGQRNVVLTSPRR